MSEWSNQLQLTAFPKLSLTPGLICLVCQAVGAILHFSSARTHTSGPLCALRYNVVRAMGVRLAKLSPTRGFCAELSTALVIMIASQCVSDLNSEL